MTPRLSTWAPLTLQTEFTGCASSFLTWFASNFEGVGMASSLNDIILALVSTLSDELQHEFLERAAIIEFEAHLPRETAERRAWDLMRARLSK
jgi:hypothetical protein